MPVSDQGDRLFVQRWLDRPIDLDVAGLALEHVNDAVVATDPRQRVVYWSPGADRLYGAPACDALGRPLAALYRERWPQPEEERLAAAALEREGLWRGENLHVRQDGREVRVDSTVRVLRDGSGARQGLLAVTREIARDLPGGRARVLLEQLATGCALWRIVFDGEGLPVDLLFDDANEAFETLTGRRREEVLGRRASELLKDDGCASESPLLLLLEVARTGAARRFVAFWQFSGRWHSGEAHRPEPGRLAILFQDLTPLRELQRRACKSEERFRSMAELFPGALFLFDDEQRVRHANRAGLELAPRRAEAQDCFADLDFEGSDVLSMLRPAIERAFASGEIQRLELPREAGQRARAATVAPLQGGDGRAHEALGAILEKETATHSEASADRAEVEQELRASNERLELASQRKDSFLAMLSHELRNPLAPIRNSLFVLARSSPESEPARRAQRVIERQVRQLTRIVDDLLDVTRIARGKLRLQRGPLDLNRVVRRAAEDQRSVLARGGVELVIEIAEEPLAVLGDPNRLAQVVVNLLNNSAKFTPRGGRATVRVERVGPSLAAIRVSDTGVGIAPENQAQLFEPFVQAQHTLERSRGGLGLGLALVKGVVEQHGGTASVKSAGLGRGAEFSIVLPLASEEVSNPVPRPAVERSSARRRVLVVEDDEDAAESLKAALELGHHVIEVASDGFQGLQKALDFRPDVVLCELGLPGMDGCQVARTLRADPRQHGVFLVALSGFATPEDVERARQAGFDRHVAKPPDLRELERLLAAAPERR